MGASGGVIASSLINTAGSLYSAKIAGDAQKKASSKMARAEKEAADRQEQLMAEQQAAQDERDANAATRASEANTPQGESATMSFGGQDDKVGSTADFLIPKFGGSQLGTSTRSGLGT